MRIALVSCEYVGHAVSGGIGTYMRNAAHMLAMRGHDVEVFAAGRETANFTEANGVVVNLVKCEERGAFPTAIPPIFVDRHIQRPFDLIEGAEFLAETSGISEVAPEIPLVLKLHTPSSMMLAMGHHFVPIANKTHFIAGGLLRGQISPPYWVYRADRDEERRNLAHANEITAPCRAIVEALSPIWGLSVSDVSIIPNVFIAPKPLLDIPLGADGRNVVTFIGRMEMRKGVLDLAEAIPLVLRKFKGAHFRLVGRSLPHPGTGKDMAGLIKSRLKSVLDSVEFIDSVPYEQIHHYYAASDICVFPSIWENFPNVCLEAMAAGRGVIGSNAGGMAEIIEHGKTGLLVPPRDPRAIAEAILTLLRDPERRKGMGRAAREHVTHAYAPGVIAPLQEASYELAIDHAGKKLGTYASAASLRGW